MKSNKPYTAATFTKRVDQDAGRHRTQRAPTEPKVCEECGAVYSKRRWVSAEVARANQSGDRSMAQTTLCPACKQKKAGVPAGFVYLEGAFFDAHHDEIYRLLKNEAKRSAIDNPLGQIIEWKEAEKGRLTISTTTEHLAKRLGQSLEKAFSGEVRYDFSHENKFARVYWHRD